MAALRFATRLPWNPLGNTGIRWVWPCAGCARLCGLMHGRRDSGGCSTGRTKPLLLESRGLAPGAPFLARAKPPQSPPRKRTRPDDNDAHDALTIYTSIVDNQGMGKPTDLVQGTLDLLILRTLANEPKHGWAIAKRIQQISKEVLQVQQGSLYPALHRLEQRGWITAKWAESETGRQAKFYRLTSDGRKQLERETANWKRLSQAINLVVSEA